MQLFLHFTKKHFIFAVEAIGRGGKSSLLLIAVLFVFSTLYFSSCAKEDVVPDEVADVGDVLGKKGGGDDLYKDVEPDCQCEMRVLSVTGHSGGWYIQQPNEVLPNYPYMHISGVGNTWLTPSGSYSLLPSTFESLLAGATDCYHLKLFLYPVPQQDVTINTEVRCYANGSISPATITYHQFVVPAGEQEQHYYRRFLCRYLWNDESADCSRTGTGSSQ